MKYYDYYLKANDEAHLYNSIEFLEDRSGVNIDVVGYIYKDIGTEEEPDYVAQEGYHANLRLPFELTEAELRPLPLIIPPDTPVRVWA